MPSNQPIRGKAPDREEREYDTSALTDAVHGKLVHRDYAAHFFRWVFVSRAMAPGERILDVGCGVEAPLARVLTGHPSRLPSYYLGVDLNPQPKRGYPGQAWAKYRWGFNFADDWKNLGEDLKFSRVVSFEAIEHMDRDAGQRLLAGLHYWLETGGTCYLSTPVYDGHRARNHIHEYEVAELQDVVEAAGFTVRARYGTFGNVVQLRQWLSPEQAVVWGQLEEYYGNDALSVMFAPMFPDKSRNNMWVLGKK